MEELPEEANGFINPAKVCGVRNPDSTPDDMRTVLLEGGHTIELEAEYAEQVMAMVNGRLQRESQFQRGFALFVELLYAIGESEIEQLLGEEMPEMKKSGQDIADVQDDDRPEDTKEKEG